MAYKNNAKTKTLNIKFNEEVETDLISKMEHQKNKSQYVKSLIRKDTQANINLCVIRNLRLRKDNVKFSFKRDKNGMWKTTVSKIKFSSHFEGTVATLLPTVKVFVSLLTTYGYIKNIVKENIYEVENDNYGNVYFEFDKDQINDKISNITSVSWSVIKNNENGKESGIYEIIEGDTVTHKGSFTYEFKNDKVNICDNIMKRIGELVDYNITFDDNVDTVIARMSQDNNHEGIEVLIKEGFISLEKVLQIISGSDEKSADNSKNVSETFANIKWLLQEKQFGNLRKAVMNNKISVEDILSAIKEIDTDKTSNEIIAEIFS